jgi:hypothetical protein
MLIVIVTSPACLQTQQDLPTYPESSTSAALVKWAQI